MKSLYKEYRPKNFDEVVGQKVVKKILINSIILNKINHSYLFYGIRGTGKTTLARIFAKALNCEDLVEGNPCNKCNSCKEISNSSSFDVIEMDAATNSGVDEIRAINEKVNYLSTNSKYKIYIIDEVHGLSRLAFSALLKTLEEPPQNVVFLLATTEIHKIPETILSRTITLNLELISIKDLVFNLETILKKEGIKYEYEALKYISYVSDGSMRDAISNLESVILYSNVVDEKSVIETLQVLNFKKINEIFDKKQKLTEILENSNVNFNRLIKLLINYLITNIDNLSIYKKNLLNELININIKVTDALLIKNALINIFDFQNRADEPVEKEVKKEKTKIIEEVKIKNNKKSSESSLLNTVEKEFYSLQKKREEEKNALKIESITDYFNTKHYLTVFFNNSKEKLKNFSDKYDFLPTYTNKKEWIKYIDIISSSTPYLANDDAVIIWFSDEKKYENYKKYSLNSEMISLINTVFGNNLILLPMHDKQKQQLNLLYEKLKKQNSSVNLSLVHPYLNSDNEYRKIFGEKLEVVKNA